MLSFDSTTFKTKSLHSFYGYVCMELESIIFEEHYYLQTYAQGPILEQIWIQQIWKRGKHLQSEFFKILAYPRMNSMLIQLCAWTFGQQAHLTFSPNSVHVLFTLSPKLETLVYASWNKIRSEDTAWQRYIHLLITRILKNSLLLFSVIVTFYFSLIYFKYLCKQDSS